MNNVITILVDSVTWDCVGTRRCKVSPTPFIDSLRKEGITASRLYSQGPYTNAATRSLYTGRMALDDFGYYFGLNTSPTTHYQAFHENGYETIGVYYPYYMIGSNIKQYIDHSYYTSGFDYNSELGGIFNDYKSIVKTRGLNDNEILILRHRVHLMFEIWLDFYHDIENNPQAACIIRDYINTLDVKKSISILETEYSKFKKNPIEYIISVIEQGKQHILAEIEGGMYDDIVDKDFLRGVYKKHRDFFHRCARINIVANIFKNAPSFKRIIQGICRFLKSHDKNDLIFILNYFMCLEGVHKVKRESLTKPHWQAMASARKQLNHIEEILNKRNVNKPFYLSLHFLEAHHRLSFFTFDRANGEEVDQEFRVLSDYLGELGNKYVGNLPYYLSLRYIDFCIEQFAQKLKDKGLWDNTTLLIVADHGSSYSYYPLHGRHVNCFDDECYHIPMIIRHPGITSFDVKSYHNSNDILPTLYDVLGIKKPEKMTGVSMLDPSQTEKPYVMTEYMGPGCPDMLNSSIWFSARDEHYVVAYKVKLYENFKDGDLCEVYDLAQDPLAQTNIAGFVQKDKIYYLLEPIKKRYIEIKANVENFIATLKAQE